MSDEETIGDCRKIAEMGPIAVRDAIRAAREQGRREGLEEAAKVCEGELTDDNLPLTPHGISRNEGCLDCAAAIRARLTDARASPSITKQESS